MIIGSISENKKIEKRIAITPETAKKYIANGFDVLLPKNYGEHLGFHDSEYDSLGVKTSTNEKEILVKSDVIIQLGLISDENLSELKEKQSLVGILNP